MSGAGTPSILYLLCLTLRGMFYGVVLGGLVCGLWRLLR